MTYRLLQLAASQSAFVSEGGVMLGLISRLCIRRRLLSSQLFSERTFYRAFSRDLSRARKTVAIESPYMTLRRVHFLASTLQRLVKRGVRVRVNTRYPACHNAYMQAQAKESERILVDCGVRVYNANLELTNSGQDLAHLVSK